MRAAYLSILLVLASALRPVGAFERIIFDTDMLTDFDDVGALACLHALADAGECEILATVSCTRGNASVAAIEVINGYYGRPDIPVGCVKGIGIVGANTDTKSKVDPASPLDKRPGGDGGHYKYRKLARDYAKWVRHLDSDDAPDANDVYRRILAAAEDKSVTICSVGFLTNLRRLLETPGDAHSPLDGRQLVGRKVKRWVAMAGSFPKGSEYNLMCDAESARIVLGEWPTPAVFSDFQYGCDVFCGRKAAEQDCPASPVCEVFRENLPSREEIARDPKLWARRFFGPGGRASWDETAVLVAVCGTERYFNVERGRFRMVGAGWNDEWIADAAAGPHLRIVEKTPKQEVADVIDELICRGKGCLLAHVDLCDAVVPVATVGPWNAGAPRINGPAVYGATPGRFFLYAFPTVGSREGLVFGVRGTLPAGVSLDASAGVLSGRTAAGEYAFEVEAVNRMGRTSKRFTLIVGEGRLALTPPMGWTSWNACESHVQSEYVRAAAESLVEQGLAARGYAYVNIDSGWQGERDVAGEDDYSLKPNGFFPDMKTLVDDIHGLGLKCGIYCSPMIFCWASGSQRHYRGCTDFPADTARTNGITVFSAGFGQKRFERQDAAAWARLGFDFLKYDWPVTDVEQSVLMRRALDATDRDFVLQLCTGCELRHADRYAGIGQLLRSNCDAWDEWGKIKGIAKAADPWLAHVRPGCWYDPDMLALGRIALRRNVGKKDFGQRGGLPSDTKYDNRLSRDEQIFHFLAWAVTPCPLFLSCDLSSLDPFTRDLVCNEEILAINQDYPAQVAEAEDMPDGLRILRRRLSDGRRVWAFFNFSDVTLSRTVPLGGVRRLRDPLGGRDVGFGSSADLRLAAHSARIVMETR